jgi:hypothetical protein
MVAKMRDCDFTRKLNKAAKMAHDLSILRNEIDEESVNRHGFTPSEVDCDVVLDAIDFTGSAGITAAKFDASMAEAIAINTDCTGKVRTN